MRGAPVFNHPLVRLLLIAAACLLLVALLAGRL